MEHYYHIIYSQKLYTREKRAKSLKLLDKTGEKNRGNRETPCLKKMAKASIFNSNAKISIEERDTSPADTSTRNPQRWARDLASDLPEHWSHLWLPWGPINDLLRFLLNLSHLAMNWQTTHVLLNPFFLSILLVVVVVLHVLHLIIEPKIASQRFSLSFCISMSTYLIYLYVLKG